MADVWWESLRDFFFPPFCLACDGRTLSPGHLICEGCWQRARSLEGLPFRITAGRVLIPGGAGAEIDGTDAVYGCCAHRWNNCCESILHAFKYKDYPNLAKPLAEGAIDMIRRDTRLSMCDFIVPVPLTAAKRRERGYNQAELLARPIAEAMGMRLDTEFVARRGRSRSQTKLSARQRKENVRGVFFLKEGAPFAGRSVLVVDDVITTGATAGEIAGLLLDAGGARNVRVAAVVQAAGGRTSS